MQQTEARSDYDTSGSLFFIVQESFQFAVLINQSLLLLNRLMPQALQRSILAFAPNRTKTHTHTGEHTFDQAGSR